jgi:DNA-binding HxlR family transcriptional regulator
MEVKMTMPAQSDALSGALARVGDRWSLLVVDALMDGPRRFAELQEAVSGIATNVLSQRLRQLEGDGVLMAVPYSRRPVRYAYSLTAAGRDLGAAARLLAQWNADHGGDADNVARTPPHSACGTPLEARWWCPTCEVLADAPAETESADVIWV